MGFIDGEAAMKLGRMALVAIIIVVVGAIVIKLLLKLEHKLLQRSDLDAMLHKFFLNITKIVLWIIVLLTAMDYLGIKATSLLTMFAAAGAAVALALKDSLGNFAGGLLIMFTKPFSKGDVVECLGVTGKVDSIDLLYTTIITLDNKVVTIPNGQLTNSTVTNATKQLTRRADFEIGISYEADIEKAMNAILALAAADENVFSEPAPFCGVERYDDSAVALTLRVWCRTSDYWDVRYGIQNSLKDALDAAGVSIPYPQMDIRIESEKRE